jgi:predicted pyridoxine 5'-phosphate oxidase superfamily flavin-nucleotide-binding protein
MPAIINEESKKIIEENPVAFATVDLNSNPNVIGVAYVKVVSPDEVIITDNFMKQTKENVDSNRNVCLAVWDQDWNGYKLIGQAEYFTVGKWKKYVEQMPENKDLAAKGAILITVSQIIKLG